MKVAVWLKSNYKSIEGGGFSYYDMLIEGLDKHTFLDTQLVFLYVGRSINNFTKEMLHIPYYRYFLFLLLKGVSIFFSDVFALKIGYFGENFITRFLIKNKIKIVFYPVQGNVILKNFPFISNNWDIGHRSTYSFPELTNNGVFEDREKWYNGFLKKALLVFCESEAGKREVIQYTGINEDRVKVVPTFAGKSILVNIDPNDQINILSKYQLNKNEFFFYPAQFWAHKNHYGLILAFKMLLQMHPEQKLVLTGSDRGNFKYIKTMVETLGIQKSVIFGGFVSVNEISTFYRYATALIMPTFFGPTNMPILEALSLNCPVVCSDIEGHYEIMKDAALYFPSNNINKIVECMIAIVRKEIRNDLLIKAQKVLSESNFNIQKAMISIEMYFKEIQIVRKCWE